MNCLSTEDITAGHQVALSIALRDCLSCFDNVLDAKITEERVETWQRVLDEHGAFDYPQGVAGDDDNEN